MHVYACFFIYLFQIYSIYVYSYAYVNMLVIRRGTASPPVKLMFLGEHVFFSCVPVGSGEWVDFC